MNAAPKNRRHGKVARLPQPFRDKVKKLLDDGVTYAKIIAELEQSGDPALPYKLTVDNLSNWFDGGYQDYQRANERAERLKMRTDECLDETDKNPTRLTAGALHAATIEMCELMDDVMHSNQGPPPDSDKFVRMANSLTRMSRLTMSVQQYREMAARLKQTAALNTEH
jgi:hypothetical protein